MSPPAPNPISVYLDGLFYRAIQWVGALMTPRPITNYSADFTLADDEPNKRTNVSLAISPTPTSRTVNGTSPVRINGGASATLAADITISVLEDVDATVDTLVMRDADAGVHAAYLFDDGAVGQPTEGLVQGGSATSTTYLAHYTSTTVPLFVFDPTTGTITIGNDAEIGEVTTAAAAGGTINLSVGGLNSAVSLGPTSLTVICGSNTRFQANSTGIGFYATAPIAKPNVTGSRGGNAALASLLTELANLGLITDGTSA